MSLNSLSEIIIMNQAEETTLLSMKEFLELYKINHFIVDGFGCQYDDMCFPLAGKNKLNHLNSIVKNLFDFIDIKSVFKNIVRTLNVEDRKLLSDIKKASRLMLQNRYYDAWLFLSDSEKSGDLGFLVFNSDSIYILDGILESGFYTIDTEEGSITYDSFELYSIAGKYVAGAETSSFINSLSFADELLIKKVENQFEVKVFLRLNNFSSVSKDNN